MWKLIGDQDLSRLFSVGSRRVQNSIVALFLFLILLLTAGSICLSVWKLHGYIIGDWLINYRGGFVRRGLFGEVVLNLSDLTAIGPEWIVGSFQIFLYAVFFVFSYFNLLKQKSLKPYWLLIFSPFLFCFQVITIGGGGRKEIIFFAVLSAFVWAINRCSEKTIKRLFFVILLLWPVAVLTHEMLVLFLPYLFLIYSTKIAFCKKDLRWQMLLLVLTVLALVVSVLHPGTDTTASGILGSLNEREVPVGVDSVNWLRKDVQQSVAAVHYGIQYGRFVSIYSVSLILVAIGFLPLVRKIKVLFRNRVALFFFICAYAGSCCLAAVAIDWGRWIYINAVALFLITLVKLEDEPPCSLQTFRWPILLVLSGIYLSVWNLPSYGESWPINVNISRMMSHVYKDGLLDWL